MFRRWVLGNGMRECVEALGPVLEAARMEAVLWALPGALSRRPDGGYELQAPDIDRVVWHKASVVDARSFDRLTLPNKMSRLETRYAVERPRFADDVLTLNVARNCLTHRGGVVGTEDLDHGENYMTVKWRRWRMRTERDGALRVVRIGERVDGVLHLDEVERSRRFRLGQKVRFSAEDFVEIATTFFRYGEQLQASLMKLPAGRFAAEAAAT